MKWIADFFKRATCKHKNNRGLTVHGLDPFEYTVLSCEPNGVTLGWGGTPEVNWHLKSRCHLCGTEFEYDCLLPLKKAKKNERGWPIFDDGSQMPIANH